MRDHSIVSPQFWIGDNGFKHKTPTIVGRLKFKIPLHAKLRAFIFRRDKYMCKVCGKKGVEISEKYDGRETMSTEDGSHLVVDHIVSRKNGGCHHPDNLQALCDSCNARKSGLIDSKFCQVGRRL